MSSKKTLAPLATKKTTLDSDYTRQAKQFTNDYNQIPVRKKKLKQLQNQVESMSRRQMSEMTTEEITTYHSLRNEITDLEKTIKEGEDLTQMTDFYLKTGGLLIEYYNNSGQHAPENKKKAKTSSAETPPCTISSFFKTKPKTPANNAEVSNKPLETDPKPKLSLIKPLVVNKPLPPPTTTVAPTNQLRTISSLVKTNTTFQKGDMYEEYLSRTDPHHLGAPEFNKEEDFCMKCKTYRELIGSEALLVCPSCGDEVVTLMESDKPSYKDPPHENMYFAYKKINHFKEQLSHSQAKETTKIPQEVYDVILVEFKKEKKTNLASLSFNKVRSYLQKYSDLGYNKYYENINQIISHLNGMQPLMMPPEVEEQLCNMFNKIQEPFERHCPPGRRNFLSYSYVINKFCQLLGHFEYMPYFNLLKSKDKLHDQDKIWKKICADLGWKYHAS